MGLLTGDSCEHPYDEIVDHSCNNCGEVTHHVNWEKQNKFHKEWIDSGKAVYGGWWSI